MIEGVKEVGVVGAGTMGAGVAQTFAAAGYPVRLRDIGEAPLTRGMSAIKKSLERQVGRGNLKPEDSARNPNPALPKSLRLFETSSLRRNVENFSYCFRPRRLVAEPIRSHMPKRTLSCGTKASEI